MWDVLTLLSVVAPVCQVEWLRTKIEAIPTRLVFESALELMSCTKVTVLASRMPKMAVVCLQSTAARHC